MIQWEHGFGFLIVATNSDIDSVGLVITIVLGTGFYCYAAWLAQIKTWTGAVMQSLIKGV